MHWLKTTFCLLLAGTAISWAGDGRFEISQQLMPFTITNSGSYVLTENLEGSAAASGITIATNDVTLDLNGFTVAGVGGSLSGIEVSGPWVNIIIKNGVLRGWGQTGINASTTSNSVAQDVEAINNVVDGIGLGAGGSALNCNAASNGRDGISVKNVSLVADCNSRANGRYGILAGDYSAIENNTSRENGSSGIKAGQSCVVLQNAMRANRASGIEVDAGSLVSDCAVHQNASNGVSVLAAGVKVQRLVAFGNGGFGVAAAAATMVENSSFRLNTNGGIRLLSHSFAINNSTDQSPFGQGISLTGTATRIENNHATLNGVGYGITGTNNVIVMNTAYQSGTTNYLFSSTNNFYQVIVNPGSSSGNFDEPWGSYDLF